jgi:hypothetical protein
VWWVFPLFAVLPIGVELPIALFTHAPHPGLLIGFGLGAGLAATLLIYDSPPAHIENWRRGAYGEKATARALRPLRREGWTFFNDIPTEHGNIDHVLVGPAGVFMLESKRLSGQVGVEAGTLVVRWHEAPDDGYENRTIAQRARAAAFELHSRIDWPRGTRWVHPVVVLWSDFVQGSIESDRVAWVRGDQLASVLANRPIKLSTDDVRLLTAETRKAVVALREADRRGDDEPTSSSVGP